VTLLCSECFKTDFWLLDMAERLALHQFACF